jgi:hypothetical protein
MLRLLLTNFHLTKSQAFFRPDKILGEEKELSIMREEASLFFDKSYARAW